MTVLDLINKLLHQPPDAVAVVCVGLYDSPKEVREVLEYDPEFNDVWLSACGVGQSEVTDDRP